MSAHPLEDLDEWTAGTLPPARRLEVAQHLRACESCRAQAAEIQMAMDALAFGPFQTRGIWQGVSQQLRGGKAFEQFSQQLEELFDLPAAEVKILLEAMSRSDGWLEGPAPGVAVFPVNAGPKVSHGLTAFLKIDPGAEFPLHEHGGPERVLVLQGGYQCSTGIEVWRGEEDHRLSGTSHAFVALPGVPCVAAAVTYPPEN